MISVLLYPQFNPVLVQLGPFGIRWYALAYIASLVHRLAPDAPFGASVPPPWRRRCRWTTS